MAEKEYIERNELIENLNRFAPEHYNALVNQIITKQPAADVAEVVRCKDCKYRYSYSDFDRRRQETYDAYECGRLRCDLGEDGFCSCGERKSNV